MTSSLDKIKSIFIAALEYGVPDERAAYLEKACGNDRELRHLVGELLQIHEYLDSDEELGPADGME